MNRNPARPKIMQPCTCPSRFVDCNCEAVRYRWHMKLWQRPAIYSAVLVVLSMELVWYAFRG
jgi:hypothetical protein